MKGKSRRRTKYQMLLQAKKSYCAGRINKTKLNEKVKAYVDDATKKGKTKTEAQKIAKKVVSASCSVASSKGKKKATKRKTTSKRKTTRRRA